MPGDIEPNPKQLHAVSTRSGLQLEELTPKKRDIEVSNREKKVEEVVKSSNVEGIPKYAKYVKDIVASKMRLTKYKTVALTEECSSRIQNRLPKKLKDPGSFIVPKRTTIILQLADRSVPRPEWVVEDVLVQVGSLIFSVDFVVLEFEPNSEVPFILGRPFLATGKVLIDVAAGQLTMRAHDKVEVFDVYCALKLPYIYEELSVITVVDRIVESQVVVPKNPLERVLVGHEIEGDTEAQEIESCLNLAPIDTRRTQNCLQVDAALRILKRRRKAIEWQMAYIRGISSALCMHIIYMEEDHKPKAQHQRRLNPMIKKM
ncbi:hypothetical protein R3W88_018782 [Solanum pinnatisectum]|uniref:Uncharacterized protein n=1 Tax=Solanum pinnatisectum TaxID=50273 RepID=A0AAV9KJT5_9SOLN|nr:hypothetical protein R3W88_018782 [Solanum pinnatisectum]